MIARISARLFLALGLITACGLLAACSHYRLGTGTAAKFQTLFIAPVASKALIPQTQAVVTTQLREAFIKDGRVTLVNSAAEADAVLSVTITGYKRDMVVSQTNDTGLARRYDNTLTALATLKDNRTSEIHFNERELSARKGAFTDNGLVPAEYQLLPILAEQLATQAVHATLDVW